LIDSLFTTELVSWYNENKRNLPWRETSDPYNIWLSEVILQQTRVAQGLPYYQKFIELFPSVHILANAEEKEVLRAWQGLGYYSRARNLHRCAKIISEKMNGIFPDNYSGLLKLPGIGDYTAAAIASIAYGEKVAVVDGNVFRVMARYYGIESDIASGKGKIIFQKKANELVLSTQPDVYNQAIMEFGALQCIPKNPGCDICPLNIECIARKEKLQDQLPIKSKKVKVKKRYFHYFVFKMKDELLLGERQDSDIWKGLYDFYLYETLELKEQDHLINETILKDLKENIITIEESRNYKHILTHQHIYAKFFIIELNTNTIIKRPDQRKMSFYDQTDILDLPKPVLISSFLNDYIF
jgi:A/G-specific adenine glycosylase